MKCEYCGSQFKSYNANPKYCSRNCKDKALISKVDHAMIASLYKSGHTQDEISLMMNCGRKTVFNSLKRQNVKCRIAAKRNQNGENNHSWRGNGVGYKGCHDRVRALFGEPKKCEICGTTDQLKTYDWANLTGNYKDPSDYKRMCRSCHWKFDKKHLNFNGRKCITS